MDGEHFRKQPGRSGKSIPDIGDLRRGVTEFRIRSSRLEGRVCSGANSGSNTDSDPGRMCRIRTCDRSVHLVIGLKYDERETRPYRICHDVSRFGNPTQQNPV